MCMCIYYFTTNPTTKTNPNKTNLNQKPTTYNQKRNILQTFYSIVNIIVLALFATNFFSVCVKIDVVIY